MAGFIAIGTLIIHHELLGRTTSASEFGGTSDTGRVAVFTGIQSLRNHFISSIGTGGYTVPFEQKLEDLTTSTNILTTAGDAFFRTHLANEGAWIRVELIWTLFHTS